MRLLITLTWSKIMAFLIIIGALYLDISNHTNSTFMFTVPFASALILGKQYFDKNRTYDSTNKE